MRAVLVAAVAALVIGGFSIPTDAFAQRGRNSDRFSVDSELGKQQKNPNKPTSLPAGQNNKKNKSNQ